MSHSDNNYDAIVVGAGIGGLAAALLLAHSGKRVVILEKRLFPGGRLCSVQRDGFTLDFGVHLVSRGEKGPLAEVLRCCDADDEIEFTKVRPVQSTGGEIFKFPWDLKGRVPDSDFDAILRFVSDVKGMSDEETHSFDDMTLRDFLSRYTNDPFAHASISQVGFIYCCIPEYRLSAGEFCRCLKWEAEAHASGYPSGGCGAIVKAYTNALEKYKAEIKCGSPVDSIIVENGCAVGVVSGGEEYHAPLVVSNADLRNTVNHLVGVEHFDKAYVDYVNALQYSYTSIIARFALDTVISPDIKMLSNFPSMDAVEYAKTLMSGGVPDDLCSFIVVPSSFDSSVAPEGKQLVMMTTAVPDGINEEYCHALMDKLIESAEVYFPGLRSHAEFVEKVFPSDANRAVGEAGCGIGVAQDVGQAGTSRPSIKTPLEGLYIVGGEAGGSGVGIEMCCNSAMEFFDTYIS